MVNFICPKTTSGFDAPSASVPEFFFGCELYIAARVYVVHIGIEDDLEHHPGMAGATTSFPIQLFELTEIKILDYGIDNAHRVVFS